MEFCGMYQNRRCINSVDAAIQPGTCRMLLPAVSIATAATGSFAATGKWVRSVLTRRFIVSQFGRAGTVHDLARAEDGTVWILSDAELLGITPAATDATDLVHEQRYANIGGAEILFVDRENIVWLSAQSRLERLQGERFRHYSLRTGPASHNVWSITADQDGRKYFGTHETVLRLGTDDYLLDIGAMSGIPAGHVRDLIIDDNNTIWVGVKGVGLYRLDVDSLRAKLVAGTTGVEILDMELDSAGKLWIATEDRGVLSLDRATMDLASHTVPDGGSVYTIESLPDGSIWYGVDDVGLVHLKPLAGGSYEESLFGAESGLDGVSFNHIVAFDSQTLWIGALDGSLFRFQDGLATNIGPQTPLFDQSAYTVEPLSDSQLIVGGEMGLYRIDTEQESTVHYGLLDGFAALETNAHATFRDADGYLWLGTVDGATRMDTSLPTEMLKELQPQALSTRSNGRRDAIPQDAKISWSGRDVAIEYAAVSLHRPQNIEYSYRLVGLHDQWQPATRNRTIEFTSLAPGKYHFEVRARHSGEEWGPVFTGRNFEILRPFWLSAWFVALLLVAALFLVRAVMNLRTRRMEVANSELREQVLARTRSIAEANERLAYSNRRLESEIEERRRADEACVEIESQMQLAFENTPIGMGMIGADNRLYGANPALRALLWPGEEFGDDFPDFMARLNIESRDVLKMLLMTLVDGSEDNGTIDAVCTDRQGTILQTTITLTAVRATDSSLLYALLHLQDVTEARQLTDLLEVQANYDELTGLLNRRAFEVELNDLCMTKDTDAKLSYLLFMDLDRFKIVNDTSGHSAGDVLLREVADIMRGTVRTDDTLARLGGDEFGLILRSCNKSAATRIAESIRTDIEDHRFHWDGETHRIGISIGAVPIGRKSSSVNDLEQLADAACYSAKNEGRNCIFFVEDGEESVQKNRGEARWVQRLRGAMDNRQFALYGQIIKPLRAGKKGPERVEVLLRMRDPATRKLIPPGAFLPAAERYGLSTELDQWVVGNLLDTLFVHDAFGAAQSSYWVNLSGASVGDKRFSDFLVGAMRDSPLPPGMINFEITETAVIRNLSEARRLIVALRDMGCQFALDDFGSGLSSFGYLKKLPVDCVKIDGMFIRDILTDESDRIFVKSIIDIAATMGVKSVAEFVENQAILAVVCDLGVDYAQGFGVHRPELISPEFPGRSFFDLGSKEESVLEEPMKNVQ